MTERSLSDVLDLWLTSLAWFVQLMAVPVALGAAFALLGVLIFGPRTADSLILPALTVFAVTLLALSTGVLSTDAPALLITVAAVIGVGGAGIQREIGDRLDVSSPIWPQVVGVGGIVAGAVIGGVLAFAIFVHEEWPVRVVVGAVIGGVMGTVAREVRQPRDLDTER